MTGSGARVLSWNVWWRFGPRWRDRQPRILATLREAAPDVVALQECWGTEGTTQAHELAAALGFGAAFAAPSLPPVPERPEHPEQEGVRLGIGLLSRWPITAVRQVPLPARHRPEPPVSLVATLAHPAGQLPVIATCLEWEPAYASDRVAQAQAVADLATDPSLDGPAPVIVMGDLNAAPDSPVLRPLLDVLTDAWAEGGGDPAAASLRSDHPFAPLEATELIDRRIDHVLVRPGRPGVEVRSSGARLLGAPIDGLDPSDHLAVACDLAWTVS
jgi:endonuclease/exonuclease/phosphatase family metal-dependent hydrolase